MLKFCINQKKYIQVIKQISSRNQLLETNMIRQQKYLQAQTLLKSLPFLSQQGIQDLPKTKNSFWLSLQKLFSKNISYAFDQDTQNHFNQILDQIDTLLSSKGALKIKKIAKKKLQSFPQILIKIIRQFQELIVSEEQRAPDQEDLKQKALQTIFQGEIPKWTYSQLSELVERKIEQFKDIKFFNLSDFQKTYIPACREFQEYFENQDMDFELVDRLILNRIGQNPNDSFNSSVIHQVQKSLDQSVTELNQSFQRFFIDKDNKCSEDKVTQQRKEEKNERFLKKESSNVVEQKPEEKSQKVEVKEEKKEQQKQVQKVSNRNEQSVRKSEVQNSSSQQTRDTLGERMNTNNYNTDTSYANQNDQTEDVSMTDFNQLHEDEDRKLNELYSKKLIERYQNQSRFTEGIYSTRRELQVAQIEQSQLKPLIAFLKSLTTRHLDRFSPVNTQIQVQVYGSWDNKTGFRKTSDININLTLPGLKQNYMHNTCFALRNLLDNCRKNGTLGQLNLRSVIYSQEHKQVILSHINNVNKKREPQIVNFIYLTINRNNYVLSSRFMKDVIFSGQQKSKGIAHLTNILHLLGKGNCILDHKDMYHTWWTQTPYDLQRKALSQSRYVSISVYSLQMMILYYLQEKGVISKIHYSKETNKFDFEIMNPFITLYENFVGFLRFYSSEGDYIKHHAGKVFIDVVQQSSPQDQIQVEKAKTSQLNNIQPINGYLFGFAHPRMRELMKLNQFNYQSSCFSYEIKRGSAQEKLFFSKIDEMFKKVANLRSNQEFKPNQLFGWDNPHFDE